MKKAFINSVGAAILCVTATVKGGDLAGSAPFQFRYAADLSELPAEVAPKVPGAHGGFAVDNKVKCSLV